MAACRLIEVSGAPFERGVQYGREAAREIRASIAHYSSQIRDLGLDDAGLSDVVAGYVPMIEGFEPSYVEEMRGIAKGADMPFERIVMINARTEVLKLAEHKSLRDGLARHISGEGCSSIIAEPRATRGGQLIHAHNWDWKKEAANAIVVLRIRRDDGPDVLTFTEAGGLARFGFNTQGIAVSGNYLECDRDYSQMGVPLSLLRRKILEQEFYAFALRAAYTTPKSGSNNIAISHSGGGMVHDFECAPDESFPVAPTNGLMIHSNHWQSQVAQGKLRETGIDWTPDSLYRDRRLNDLLVDKVGDLTVEDLKAAMLDTWQTPWSVCQPPRDVEDNNLSATVVSIVMQPAKGLMEIAVMPALGAKYDDYTLEMDSSATYTKGPIHAQVLEEA
jgi:isopenicillin-N N-acyltransferase-like protein